MVTGPEAEMFMERGHATGKDKRKLKEHKKTEARMRKQEATR